MCIVFEQETEPHICSWCVCVCMYGKKCQFGQKCLSNECNVNMQTIAGQLETHGSDRLCVIVGVGCAEFGINETMGCLFQESGYDQ